MLDIPARPRAVMDALERCGYEAWAVGGCVRDSLIGTEPHDWDVCTSARPEESKKCLSDFRVIETGIKHGTVTAIVDGQPVEVTTYRTEGGYSDSRRPDFVSFVGDVREDLSRRDFTVNAMAYSPERGLLDIFGGREDLKKGLIRCVGQPEKRFSEDALRIMRALRFASVYGFTIEEKTAGALLGCRELLSKIAAERVLSELLGFLAGRTPGRLLMEFREVFAVIIPELRPMFGFDQKNSHHIYDLWEHTCRAVDAAEPDGVLRLAVMLHDVGKPKTFSLDAEGVGHFYGHQQEGARMAEEIMRRLRASNQVRERVTLLVAQHDMPIPENEKAMRRQIAKLGPENIRDILKMHLADAGGQGRYADALPLVRDGEALLEKVLREADCLSLRDLEINGRDLLEAGIPPGPQVGRELKRLFDLVLSGELRNSRPELLRAVKGGGERE